MADDEKFLEFVKSQAHPYDIRSSEENRLRNKFDKRIMSLVCLLCGFCFLDRVNVGFASLAGLQKENTLGWVDGSLDVHLDSVSAACVRLLSETLANFASFGGMLPGIAFLLSKFYRRQELTYNIGWMSTWRNASWLTKEEKMLAVSRLETEYPAVTEAAHHTRIRTFRQGLFNVNTWLVAMGFLAAVFLPTVVATRAFEGSIGIRASVRTPMLLKLSCLLRHSSPRRQQLRLGYFLCLLRIIVPYVLMRMDTCGPFMAVLAGVGVIGYAIFVGVNSLHARYAACFLMAAGSFHFGVASPGLVAVNTGPDATRAVALGVLSSVGYIGASSAPGHTSVATPDYRKGNTVNLAGMAIVLVFTVVKIVHMKWENARRNHGACDHCLQGLNHAEEAQFGHLHPRFCYKI
ncbi:hypothetical protein C8R43DRAFT_1106995 [Mycena crocata]|nr:hypothetical protein C8R43DRAFT_1106995 [Mycena crocata]